MRRNAVLFVLISLLSGFGSTTMTLAAGLWVLDLTGSVSLAALTAVCIYAPTLAAPWLGALVDRLPRRPLVIGVDLGLGLLLLTLLAVRSAAAAWLIFAVLLARGASYVLIEAGESAIMPSALPTSMLGDVNGWRSSAQEGTKLIAPVAGAALYAWHGPIAVVLLSASMPLLTAACYAAVRLRHVPVEPRPAPGRSGLREGLRALFSVPAVRNPVLLAAVAIGGSGLKDAAVLAHLVHDLHLPSTHLGLLGTGQGAGSIAGGLMVGRVLARRSAITVAAVGAVVFAAGCVSQALPWFPAMVAGSVVIGIGLPWTLIAAVTAVQTLTPDHLLGRVAATANTIMFGPVAIGIPLGAAAIHIGAVVPLVVTATTSVAAAVIAVRATRKLSPVASNA
ncbi:MFS transporter [Paractinoplanes abujensis]|uniref:MFS family permease n=1 Tax=Paractinoplanes abujensis TaxID=882441 RepID=A0A7W7CVQ0_9ACTN|nr:MFS transporter [Actinoplanes abujensis]MBB4694355.1 MFS family permease [Actinoplanes abujensis]GID20430.1 MFS transporter [Actinoplanes abujensis]